MIINIIFVGLGSFCGGVLRYLFGIFINNYVHLKLPLSTIIVNLVGCFCIGLFTKLLQNLHIDSNIICNLRLVFIVGFCGGFTTFSTFCLDTLKLLSSGNYLLCLVNISISLLCGLLLIFIAYRLNFSLSLGE